MRLLGAWGWIAIQALVKLQCIGGTLFSRLHPDQCFIVICEYHKQDFWFTWQSRPHVINKKYLQDTIRIARCRSSKFTTGIRVGQSLDQQGDENIRLQGYNSIVYTTTCYESSRYLCSKLVWVWILSGLTLERQWRVIRLSTERGKNLKVLVLPEKSLYINSIELKATYILDFLAIVMQDAAEIWSMEISSDYVDAPQDFARPADLSPPSYHTTEDLYKVLMFFRRRYLAAHHKLHLISQDLLWFVTRSLHMRPLDIRPDCQSTYADYSKRKMIENEQRVTIPWRYGVG